MRSQLLAERDLQVQGYQTELTVLRASGPTPEALQRIEQEQEHALRRAHEKQLEKSRAVRGGGGGDNVFAWCLRSEFGWIVTG
jgi:hypothetical protein